MVSVRYYVFVVLCCTHELLAYIQRGDRVFKGAQDLKWPFGIVPYEFSPDFSAKEKLVILKAMESISTQTCVKFITHTNEQDFLSIRVVRGHHHRYCWSSFGRTTGEQLMQLGVIPEKSCVEHGTVLHYLMRVLGFEMEHRRPDRDEYVDINWNNIKSTYLSEFSIIPSSGFIYDWRKEPYDYFSLMHPNATKFAIDSKILIISPKFVDESAIGQRDKLSNGDVRKIQDAYNCPKATLSNSGEMLINVTNLWFPNFLFLIWMMGSQVYSETLYF